jgi:hypothetical protein
MAVVATREIYRGRARSTTFGDVPTFTRIYIVTVDDIKNDFQEISEAPGVAWLDTHPEDSSAYLTDSNVQQEADSPFHYRVTFTYKGMKPEEAKENPTDREPQFSFSGSLASAPCFWHYPNPGDNSDSSRKIIINTAGDPIGGLDRDEGEFTVTISANTDPPFPYVKAQNYVGAINSDSWSGGATGTWKCMSISGNRKIEQVNGEQYIYYEVSTTLAYRGTGWNLQTWDVGFNEIVGGQRKKIMAGSEPVSEPAALSNGRAKTPGQPPDMLAFRIYKSLTFNGTFPVIPDTT